MDGLLPDDERIGSNEPGVEDMFDLGMEYKRKCQYDAAIREFRAAAEKVPDLSIAHFELAKAHLLNGNNTGALKEFERAVRFGPDNLNMRFFLRYVPRFTKTLDEIMPADNNESEIIALLLF